MFLYPHTLLDELDKIVLNFLCHLSSQFKLVTIIQCSQNEMTNSDLCFGYDETTVLCICIFKF